MGVPHPIPYQGSKRGIASVILSYFPDNIGILVEPFAGSSAISLAATYYGKACSFLLNDVNAPLMNLWEEIIHRPFQIAEAYETLWKAQLGQEREYYDAIRTEFNRTGRSDCFLYLLARCVKAAVRYNAQGEFNQSPDNRRRGALPATMREHILGASRLFKERTRLQQGDYANAVTEATPRDLIYLDPPYQGVCGNRDPRYLQDVESQDFIRFLEDLNGKNLSYIVSYDGRNDWKDYGKPLPASLHLTHVEIAARRSSQATLLERNVQTVESLYLSPALVERLEKRNKRTAKQTTLTLPLEMSI